MVRSHGSRPPVRSTPSAAEPLPNADATDEADGPNGNTDDGQADQSGTDEADGPNGNTDDGQAGDGNQGG